ncbi:MAG TPA: BatA domain-containing protein [Polyangia bacterium]|nr:BatA domain-containing protein [Polyangia bacterium]
MPLHFVAPSVLLGLLAAALPWLIHRIGRRRARPVAFPAMELLLRAEREVSARRRLREVLLLLLRTLVAAALPLAFARPFAEIRSDLPAAAARSQSAVIVLDDSASLRRLAAAGGEPVFQLARARARALLESLSGDSDVALVLASEGTPAPVAEPSNDRGRVLGALDAAVCSARVADFGGALRRATQILAGSPHADRVIYVVTDLQAAGWEGAAPERAAGGPAVIILDVGGAWDNRAIVALSAEPAPEQGAEGLAVVAEIVNFSDEPAHKLGLTLRLDGADVARGFVDLPPRGRARKRFLSTLHTLMGGGTAHDAEVEIDHDLFTLDDRRRARVEVSRGLRVLVVDGDPRTVRTEDETFFLEAALRSGGAGFSITTGLPDELPATTLSGYAAVFLANVAKPSEELAEALTRYVEGGGGLFISVGDRVDVDAWNQRMKALLPQPLGLKRTAAAVPGRAPEGETVDLRPAERLAPLDRRHPLLAGFPAKGDGLASARFFQFMLMEPVPDAPGRSVVLRYENGAPALVASDVGRGRVLLLTTTVDREWTDLPIRPGFLPLMQEAARFLAGAPGSDSVSALTVGQRREIGVGAEDTRIEIVKADGQSRWLTPESRQAAARAAEAHGRRTVTFAETDEPGLYRVRASRADGTVVERASESFVVNLDPAESNPARLADDRRPDRAPAGAAAAAAPKRRLELWHFLSAAVLLAVLAESLLTLRLRRGRVKA